MTQRKKNEIRVLVVDDEPGMRDLLSYELGSQGYQVVTANDGMEAISVVRSQPIDLVISDIKMPRMDGVTALEEIKKINPNIEVIMATGYGTIETAVSAMKKGAYDFIQKPYNVNEIGALLEKALEKNELRTMIALYESSRAIFSAINIDDLLEMVMGLIQNRLRADEGAIMFLDEDQKLYIVAKKGLDQDLTQQIHLKIGERVAGWVAKNRRERLLIGGLDKYPEFSDIEVNPRIASSIVVPLVYQNELLGVLTLNRLQGHENFNSTDLQHASIFALQVAQAVRNAKLFQALEKKVEELKKAYRMLEETKTQLVESEKLAAIGRLVSGVAHEINNPLTSVLGYTELLLSVDVPDVMKKDLQTVFNEAQRCRKIVQDLLIFARRQKLSLELVQVSALVDRTLESLLLELRKNSVEVLKNYAKCPAVYLDSIQMQQVFLNILKNALQALESVKENRRIIISISVHEDKTLRLVFADNGPGISQEHADRIFDPFFTTKGVGQGTGLGLSLSYGIVKRHNGCILVESKEGQGAAFIIELPVVTETTDRNSETTVLPFTEESDGKKTTTLSDEKKILIVEDENSIRVFLKRLLSMKNFQVQEAPDGETAFTKLSREEFDLVLCDCMIPKMNGMQLFEKIIKTKPELAQRFVFVSGCSADKTFDDFLLKHRLLRVTKPFEPDDLMEIIFKKLSGA